MRHLTSLMAAGRRADFVAYSNLDGDGDSDSGDHALQLAAASTAIHASGYTRPRLRRRSI